MLADPFPSHPVAHILHIKQTHDLMVSKFWAKWCRGQKPNQGPGPPTKSAFLPVCKICIYCVFMRVWMCVLMFMRYKKRKGWWLMLWCEVLALNIYPLAQCTGFTHIHLNLFGSLHLSFKCISMCRCHRDTHKYDYSFSLTTETLPRD